MDSIYIYIIIYNEKWLYMMMISDIIRVFLCLGDDPFFVQWKILLTAVDDPIMQGTVMGIWWAYEGTLAIELPELQSSQGWNLQSHVYIHLDYIYVLYILYIVPMKIMIASDVFDTIHMYIFSNTKLYAYYTKGIVSSFLIILKRFEK